MSTYTYTCNKHRPVEAESPRDAARIFATRIARQLHGRSASAVTLRVNHYRYATDSGSGTIAAGSIECAFDKLRARITDEMILDGATLWVEDARGNRETLR